MVNTQTRKIISGWLLVSNFKPLILSINENKVHSIFEEVSKKFSNTNVIKITSHTERYKEIGRNLIKWNIPSKHINNIMEYRNSLVLLTHTKNGCWELVREKNNLPEDMEYSDMNQWLMDWMKYITKEIE